MTSVETKENENRKKNHKYRQEQNKTYTTNPATNKQNAEFIYDTISSLSQ